MKGLLEHLPPYLHALVTTAFITGWRTHSELLTRERRHLRDGSLILEPGEGKTRKAREFPVDTVPRLRDALAEQLERVASMERSMGKVIPWLFPGPTGDRIKDFRGAWQTASRKAGIPNAIPHDFRRTAVRNLNRANVSVTTAMRMVGHRTRSIYDRHNIADENDVLDGGAKLAAFFDKSEAAEQKVVPLKTGTE